MAQKEKLNFIDLFAGAGGLSCGLEMSQWKCLLGVDYDKSAMETFAANHKYAKTFCGDITNLSARKLHQLTAGAQVHAVVGGPPCQGFSTAGRGNPKDKRNKLFLEFIRIVKETKPWFIVMENVTGLLAKKNEQTLKSIFKKFNALGYYMDIRMLSSDEYGVPERRRRTILIGSAITKNIQYPKATHNIIRKGQFIPALTVGEALVDLSTSNGLIHNHDLNSATIKSKIDLKRLKRIPEGKGIRYEKDEKAYLTKSLKLDIDWSTIREGRLRQTKYFRLDRNKPSPTIMTCRHGYYHPVENRYLTQREAARLQSFPNDFVFKGTISAQWRQIGNAVPPLLGKVIGKALNKMVKEAIENGELKEQKGKTKVLKATQTINAVRQKAFSYKRV